MNLKDFGRRLKRARQAAGYRTQRDLAEALDVDRSTVGAWESGRQYPQRYIGALEHLLGSLEDHPPRQPIDPRLLGEVAGLSPQQRDWMIDWLRQATGQPQDEQAEERRRA